MDVFDAIAKRHSYRESFQDKRIEKADLRRIVEAGIKAPSGKNCQTTSFVIVDDPATLAEIGKIPGANKAVKSAAAIIACVSDLNPPAVYEGYSFQIEDCAAAVENMLLAITAMGYASVWMDGWLRLNGRAEMIGALLNVPAGKVVRILLPIGVPSIVVTQPGRKPFDQRAWFNHHG